MDLLELHSGDVIEITFNGLHKHCEFTIDDIDVIIKEQNSIIGVSINESDFWPIPKNDTPLNAQQLLHLGATETDCLIELAEKINFVIKYTQHNDLLRHQQQYSGLCKV